MKRMIALLLVVAVFLCLCACGAQNVEETEPAPVATEAPTQAPAPTETIPEGLINEEEARALTNYYVTVLDENARPVVGAVLYVIGQGSVSCITDETGVAVFSLPEGAYSVSVEELPFGYEFATEQSEFAFEAADVTMTIQVQQTFSEPEDLGMEEGDAPIEELPAEDVLIPEG